jgi:hypothetical protein
MTKDLYDEILDALKDRQEWETKQDGFYRLRHRQIRRINKPYPGAPDQRYGLPDAMIEKQKPFYIQQLYVNETIASFVAKKPQNAEVTTAAANWFDYQLKQESNFERAMYVAIDKQLESGLIPVKVYYHQKSNRLCFDACDPMHVIVPKWTEELQQADWLVHVLHLSECQYRKNPLYKQDDEFIKCIKGKGTPRDSSDSMMEQHKEMREGITCGSNAEEIVLWEVYRKNGYTDDASWVVDTISPVKGWDEEVRATFGLPFSHKMLPFFLLRAEIIDKSYFSPRGITEVVAPHEASLSKVWNAKLQHLDFHGNPTYKNTGTGPIPNASNFRQQVGGILPPGIEPVQNPTAPFDFNEEMQFTRAHAEDRVSVPDLSAGEHLAGDRGAKGNITATQVNAIVGQSGQSNDLRSRVFRLDLGEGLKMAWAVLIQYKKTEFTYILEGEIKQVPPDALHDQYIITPNGSPDSWNKGGQLQKAFARFQMFRGDPFIDQGELRKSVLELDDPRLVKRLFNDPGAELKSQQEQQAQEISIMLLGWDAEVNEEDDDKAHIQTIDEFVKRRLGTREPITPELARLLLGHGGRHMNQLSQKKDPMISQIEQLTQPVVQILSRIAASLDQPTNVLPMQPQGGLPAPPDSSPVPGGAPAAAPSQNGSNGAELAVETAIKVGNMLVNMIKAGIPVTHAEINKVMAEAGLAPLSLNPIGISELNGTDGMPVDGGELGGLPAERSANGMIMPPTPVQPPVNVINIATEKTIKVKREKDGSLTGTVTTTVPAQPRIQTQ